MAELEVQPGLPHLSVQPSVSTRSFLSPFQQLSLPGVLAATIVVLGCSKHCGNGLMALPASNPLLQGFAALQL